MSLAGEGLGSRTTGSWRCDLLTRSLEDGRRIPGQLREALLGSNTGVHVGITYTEFLQLETVGSGPYRLTGTGHCFACGRLSFILGLHGACVAVDTACSASLVALHAAGSAFARGECALGLMLGVRMKDAYDARAFVGHMHGGQRRAHRPSP